MQQSPLEDLTDISPVLEKPPASSRRIVESVRPGPVVMVMTEEEQTPAAIAQSIIPVATRQIFANPLVLDDLAQVMIVTLRALYTELVYKYAEIGFVIEQGSVYRIWELGGYKNVDDWVYAHTGIPRPICQQARAVWASAAFLGRINIDVQAPAVAQRITPTRALQLKRLNQQKTMEVEDAAREQFPHYDKLPPDQKSAAFERIWEQMMPEIRSQAMYIIATEAESAGTRSLGTDTKAYVQCDNAYQDGIFPRGTGWYMPLTNETKDALRKGHLTIKFTLRDDPDAGVLTPATLADLFNEASVASYDDDE